MQIMSHFSKRLLAKFLWLRNRFTTLTAHPMGRVGVIFIVALFAVFVVANPVEAQTAGLDGAMNFISKIIYWIAAFITKMIVLFLGAVIQIMLYNSFSTNPVVSAGWAIVRDVVNMFFVVVLIVIAFGTIFGHQRFQWQQQVPKLMIFALVINFSKTLCGIMIDFAQVIMLTFANALREVAAGNFLQLLGLNDMWKINPQSPALAGVDTADNLAAPFNQFAAAFAALFMVIIVFATIIILTVILLYRVIMLWIMIVLAPLTWFIGGTVGLINSNAYSVWWDKFKCLVMIGPVLTFFLWLTLAVAGAGAGAAADTGFNVSSSNNSGLIGNIFQMEKFMSFLIGIAMIYAGFDAAQQICQSMSGSFLGKSLKKGEGVGRGVAGLAGGAALKIGAAGGRKLGAGIRALPGRAPLGAGLQKGLEGSKIGALRALTKSGRAQMYQNVAGKMGKGFVGRAAGVAADRAAASARKDKAERVKKAGERFKGDTRDTKVNLLERVAAAGGTTSVRGKEEAKHLLTEAAGDKTMQKQLAASGALGKLLGMYGDELSSDFSGDASMTDKINKMKKENAGATGMGGTINTWEELQAQDASFFADEKNHDVIRGIQTGIKGDDGKLMDGEQAAKAGLAGRAAQRAMEGGMSAVYDTMAPKELARVKAEDLAKDGSSANHERAVNQAMDSGDMGRARELISMLGQSMSSDDGEERFRAQTSMDNLEVGLKDRMVNTDMSSLQQSQAGKMVDQLAESRAAAAVMNDGVEHSEGTVPPVEEQVTDDKSPVTEEDIPTIALDQFGNASTERIVGAIQQLSERKGDKQTALQALISGPDKKLQAESDQLIDTNNRLIAAIRTDVQERKKKEQAERAKSNEDESSGIASEIASITSQMQSLDTQIMRAGTGGDLTESSRLRGEKDKLGSKRDGLATKQASLSDERAKIEAQIDVEITNEIAQEVSSHVEVQGNTSKIEEIAKQQAKLAGGDMSQIQAEEIRKQAEALGRQVSALDTYISAIEDVQSKQK